MKVSFKICSFLAIALLLCVNACGRIGGSGETAQESSSPSQASNTTIYLNQDELPPVNDLARFLAGKPVDKFADIQSSEYYKDFAKKASQQWSDLRTRTLNPIKQWCGSNIPEFHNDTTCLFYPFGGPDLVFAFTFFPNETDYVLLGLENPGSVTMPDRLSENETREYLDSLLYSYRYINKYGFFVASHMHDDFKNQTLNGTIHLLLYTLAMENCIITSYKDVYINDLGKIVETDANKKKHPYGYKITFTKEGDFKPRSVTYLRMEASDPAMAGTFEFAYFINSYPDKICYLKSASYLLQNNEFTIMRKILLDQCDRILQDESGLAYARVVKDYDVDVFGTYTRPMNVFSYYKQEDLKNALKAKNSKPLPFKIGYASQINESVLMACTRKGKYPAREETPQQEVAASNSKDTIYKVQFKVSWNMIPPDDPMLSGIPEVDFYTDDSVYKYTAGSRKSEAECREILQIVRNKGFSDAFIVKFCNGKRIK
ncbi:MAG: hypothetical protein IKS00_08320 [Bacteroidales bacterium]|nr:hypothetical protein [Bacteroidales bacterium]